jgi:hexosaminidase
VSVGRFGHAYEAVGREPLEPMYGLQACLWTEGFRTREHVEAAIFPRLLAVAERAWHRAPWEADYSPGTVYSGGMGEGIDAAALLADFSGFATVVGARELAKLDAAGVLYRVPPPGVRRDADGRGLCNATYPGLTVRVSLDGGATWAEVAQDEPFDAPGAIVAETLSADGQRTSRRVEIASADDAPRVDRAQV